MQTARIVEPIVKTFPERMRSSAVGYVVYEYEAVGVMLILEKKGYVYDLESTRPNYYRLIFWMDCQWPRNFHGIGSFIGLLGL